VKNKAIKKFMKKVNTHVFICKNITFLNFIKEKTLSKVITGGSQAVRSNLGGFVYIEKKKRR